MSELLPLPLLLPVTGAAVCVVARRAVRLQRIVAVVTTALLLASALAILVAVRRHGPLNLQIGGWPYPYGIRLGADLFTAIMTVVAGLLGLVVTVYARLDLGPGRERFGALPLLLLMLMGVCGAFLTRDIFNLYVWFEVMLISSFVLMALGGRREQLRSALIYVTLNLVSSSLFLIGVGLVYYGTRTLDMALLSARVTELYRADPGLVLATEAVLLTAFGIKAAVFPLFFWLPASYHTPAPSVSALFAGLLTKVGVYAMIRVAVTVFPISSPVFAVLGVIAGLTMITGVLGAMAQSHIRRILSFHIVSQIGYMVAGLALAGAVDPVTRRFALAAAIFYIVHHIIVKTNLFLVAGVVRHMRGTEALDRLGGVARASPVLAASFLVSALSLAGVPPLSGFWAKLAIVEAGLRAQQYALVAVAVVAGLLTLMSMTKIWNQVFWRPAPADGPGTATRAPLTLLAPSLALAAVTVLIGLHPELLFSLAEGAARQLLGSTAEVAP